MALVEQDRVVVWRFPVEFSQSSQGDKIVPSNACTIIIMQVAAAIGRKPFALTDLPAVAFAGEILTLDCISRKGIESSEVVVEEGDELFEIDCPESMFEVLAEGIEKGNAVHQKAKIGREDTFTIPDAIAACENIVQEVDFCMAHGLFCDVMYESIEAILYHPHLEQDMQVFICIIAFERTILIVFERDTQVLTLFDSHMHGHEQDCLSGALIACCRLEDLMYFCRWMSEMIYPESQKRPLTQSIEISVLRVGSADEDKSVEFPLFPEKVYGEPVVRMTPQKSGPPSGEENEADSPLEPENDSNEPKPHRRNLQMQLMAAEEFADSSEETISSLSLSFEEESEESPMESALSDDEDVVVSETFEKRPDKVSLFSFQERLELGMECSHSPQRSASEIVVSVKEQGLWAENNTMRRATKRKACVECTIEEHEEEPSEKREDHSG